MSHRDLELQAARRPRSVFSSWSMIGWIICAALVLGSQPLLGASLFVLLAAWHLLARAYAPTVVQAAFLYQWLQVTIALWYFALTGRQILEMQSVNYQPMVLIGLVSIVVLFAGYAWTAGNRPKARLLSGRGAYGSPSLSVTWVSYLVVVVISIMLQRIAWSMPALTQLLFVLGLGRFVLLYFLIMRLMKPAPRWTMVILVLCAELAIGFAGFFATFRESLVFIGLAIVASGSFKRASTWTAMLLFGVITFSAAVTWTVIKPAVRKEFSSKASASERLGNVAAAVAPALSSGSSVDWGAQVDKMISRLWQVYYPALALARVPSTMPFEGGSILKKAVLNTLMPRILFPDKGELESESDLVRKYTGVHVAGRETGTSYAFGYVAEAYVDFGWPLLLVPIFLFGCVIGYADRLIQRLLKHPDVRSSVRVVILWSCMYLFETSWVIMIGTLTSLVVALGGGAFVLEAVLKLNRPARPVERQATAPLTPASRIADVKRLYS